MRWLRRLNHWWHRERLEAELAEELEGHRRKVQQALEMRGLPADEAARASRRQLGNATLARDDARDVWTWTRLESVWQDARYAFRTLRRDKVFALIALGTLALGIGTTTAIFSVVYGVALKPLPYGDPSALIAIRSTRGEGASLSQIELAVLIPEAKSLSGIAYERMEGTVFSSGDRSERMPIYAATGNLFDVLRVRPLLGRTFAPTDAGTRVAVLEHGWWLKQYGGDPKIIGQPVKLDDDDYQVIGVMPPGFAFPYARAGRLWIQADEQARQEGPRGGVWVTVGRVKPGIRLNEVRAELDVLSVRLAASERADDKNDKLGMRALPLLEYTVGNIRSKLFVLLGAVAFVLLIACVNVASLLLTRSRARERELAVRASIGAGRGRLVRQLLTESVILGLIAGVAGVIAARWSLGAIVSLIPARIPRLDGITIDRTVLACAAVVSLVCGLGAGLLPAWRLARGQVHDALKEGAQTAVPRGVVRLGRLFVFAETSLSLVLLVAAALMIHSFAILSRIDPGLDPERVVAVPVSGFRTPAESRALLQHVAALPGAESVSGADLFPFAGGSISGDMEIKGRPTPAAFTAQVGTTLALPAYFRTLGIHLVEGREFTERDLPGAPAVAVISEGTARQFFPGERAIGQRINCGSNWSEIVGIARDVKWALDTAPPPQVYFPYLQDPMSVFRSLTVLVKLQHGGALSFGELRSRVQAAAGSTGTAGLPISMEGLIDKSILQWKFQAVLLGVFGGVALVLAVVGIFGVTSYTVVQRTREIGVRLALGSTRRDILQLIMVDAAIPLVAGIATGLVLAVAATRVLATFLFQITPTDGPTYAATAALFVAVAAIAAAVPAHRATRVDPVITLRQE